MRLRPYIGSKDFEEIKKWNTDERTHALWCSNQVDYPIEKENFESFVEKNASEKESCAFVATSDDGKVVGFFCYGIDITTEEGMLRFVMVDPKRRGEGIGTKMMQLAVKYAFEVTGAKRVALNVFVQNEVARRCYEKAGFTVRYAKVNPISYNDETWYRNNMVIERR